ncbi:MAG: hypothetical protein ACP5NW_04975 [Candidatus Woesearchaeota archaeon]
MVLISSIFMLSSCAVQKQAVEQPELSDLQITACESADDGGTCDTKLEELGIVTKDQCCKTLGRCC